MRIQLILPAVFMLLVSTSSLADEPLFSGPQRGEVLAPFRITSVYGDRAGKQVDPVEMAAGKPTLFVFVHKKSRPGIALTKELTAYAKSLAEHGVAAGIVWLAEDPADAEAYLNRAKSSLNFVVPVGVSVDGAEGPGAYGLNRNVELTVLIAHENRIVANFALVQPSESEAAKIAAPLAKLVDQPPPDLDQLRKLGFPGRMQARMRSTDRRPAAAASDQLGLRKMMREFVNAETPDQTKQQASAIEKWVNEKASRKAALGKMAGSVLERLQLSSDAKPIVEQWRDKYGTRVEAK